MAKKEIKSVPLGLRITPKLKAALDKAAKAEDRALANYVERVLSDDLRERGFLKE